jgi:hypothetical protein
VPIRLAIVELPRLLADLIADVFSGDDAVRVEMLPDDQTAAVTATGLLLHDVFIVGVADPWRNPDQRQLGHPNRSFVYLMAGERDGQP